MAEVDQEKIDACPLPDMEHWSKHQVREWLHSLEGVDDKAVDILFEQDITGPSLVLLDEQRMNNMGVKTGPAIIIIDARDKITKFRKEQLKNLGNQSGRPCKPYPFSRCHDAYRYTEGGILDTTESGASNFIEPCHEFKAFINTTEETKMIKFIDEVIRFAAACMNSRTNGTIHFGIGDEPDFEHGQVLGVTVDKDKEAYDRTLRSSINQCFEFKHKETAQICIKPPRFVGVLNRNMTTSDKFVIEVDIVPDSTICKDHIYHTFGLKTKRGKNKTKDTTETKQKHFFVRDGSSSRNLLAPNTSDKKLQDYNKFVANVETLSNLRKQKEEMHLRVIKSHKQGSKLCEMITGGKSSLDRSYYEQYIIVTNKSHPIQSDSVNFLVELNPIAVLDFDPQSSQNGLYECFEKLNTVTPHLPEKYEITEAVEDIAEKLQLTQSTSWVFCNGGFGDEQPSEINRWLLDKGALIRNVISFLCRKDVLRNKKFLVVFLLLSRVSEQMDPLVETFCSFYQELKGTEQVLCICDNEDSFTSWKNLIEARCGVDISNRCIYELSFSEINGTILSLFSENRRSSRFLPSGGESKVVLEKKMERSLSTLDVLCVNQCEGGTEDKVIIEQNFYRGGNVSWWNFYFSEQPGSTPFIKRNRFSYIVETLIPDLRTLRKACVLFNLRHVPGCGGTTLAKHILWVHRKTFRCAVLIKNSEDPAVVAEHVVTLLKCGCEEQEPAVPVLLMIDGFEDTDEVLFLQQKIENQCLEINLPSTSPQVILLNCMRSEQTVGSIEPTGDTVFIGNKLSDDEQKQFDQKLKEIEKYYTPTDIQTFYGFMIMKKNFSEKYIENVVQHTLKSFNMDQKHGQLLAVLVLMSVYCKRAALSVSLCEDFLGLQQKSYCGDNCGDNKVEEGFETFSTLVILCNIRHKITFKCVKIIHYQFAKYCLGELVLKHCQSKAKIANFLLTTAEFFNCTQGKDRLMQDIRYILVKRYSLEQESLSQPLVPTCSLPNTDSCRGQEARQLVEKEERKIQLRFSPLIRDIISETPGLEEMVLKNASQKFQKDAIIAQLLARYYYLKQKDFEKAKHWAKQSKCFSKNSSYISDTSAQVLKHELKHAIANEKLEHIQPKTLERLLSLAKSAKGAFKETQNLAKHESFQRLQNRRDNSALNISGFLGEIQVCVLVIEVLQKVPIFSDGDVRHDILSSMLSGNNKLDQISENDPKYVKHNDYYRVLQQFTEMLYSLKYMMKSNFDFLDKFNVNLGSKFGMKESRDQVFQNELLQCFKTYAQLFCETESESLLKKNMARSKLQLHMARQFIEMQKVDTYSGILNCLSHDIELDILKKIGAAYQCICNFELNCKPVERMNYIYVNVMLSCIKLELIVEPYQKLLNLLCKCLKELCQTEDNLPLHFMAVLLLWPQPTFCPAESGQLCSYITQMKAAYHAEMREVYNGKRPIVHFFLGKKHDYQRMVHLGKIKRCISGTEEQFASMWENGMIWKNPKVKECLFRVTGEVKCRNILVNTCDPNVRVDVTPLFKSQIAYKDGSFVSFFVGFSMQGPLAIDIE